MADVYPRMCVVGTEGMQLFTLLQTYNGISIDISNGDRQCWWNLSP